MSKRPQFEATYQFENVWFRDAAKGLADLRDSEALIETYDSLLSNFTDQVDRRTFAPVRQALSLRRKAIGETGHLQPRLKRLRASMNKAAGRISEWKLRLEEFDGIEGGLVATYRLAHNAMAIAYHEPAAENLRE